MGSQVSRTNFTFSYTDEPHATRRKLILKKYPQVKKLMVIDQAFKWQVLALVLAQTISFYLLRNTTNFWILFPLAYFIGGVANHAIMLAIHEISHGMGFGQSRPLANKILAILANLPLGIPMSISFKKYHLDHHRYQGNELLDTDLPTFFEASFFKNSVRKFFWCLLQPFFYTLRPLFVHPKPMEKFELINIIVQLLFDFMVIRTVGWHVLAYMIGGSILAMGLHPVAGHFISEHTLMFENKEKKEKKESDRDTNNNIGREIVSNGATSVLNNNLANEEKEESLIPTELKTNSSIGKRSLANGIYREDGATVDDYGDFLVPETCSYYGPLNYLTFNVGYHVEHHDFPSIPGSKLHLISKIAPEFYSNLNHHTSWTYVLWKYITDPNVGPAARVRRPNIQK